MHVGNSSSGGGCYNDGPYTGYRTETVAVTTYGGWEHEPDNPNAGSDGYWYNPNKPKTSYESQTVSYSYYKMNCELTEGDWVRDTSDFNSIQPNEKISSVTITY